MADDQKKKKPGTFGCSHCGSRHDFGPNGQLVCPLAEQSGIEVQNTDDQPSGDPLDYGPPEDTEEVQPEHHWDPRCEMIL